VGYIEGGDWMKYYVEVTQTGFYEVTGRISGYAGGSLLLSFNDSIQTQIPYASTNGWQNWQDFTSSIYLEEGFYVMQALAQSDAFNINYFDFELGSSSISDPLAHIRNIKAYPNPLTNELTLEFWNTHSRRATIRLIDAAGKVTRELYAGSLQQGANTFTFSLDTQLPAGIYFIEIKDEARRYFEKVVRR
jgi:hypothetical protein